MNTRAHAVSDSTSMLRRNRLHIRRYMQTVEPLLQRGATLQLDGQRPISELAGVIERLVTGTS